MDLKNFNNIKHKYEYEYFCSMQMALLHLLKFAICYEKLFWIVGTLK